MFLFNIPAMKKLIKRAKFLQYQLSNTPLASSKQAQLQQELIELYVRILAVKDIDVRDG